MRRLSLLLLTLFALAAVGAPALAEDSQAVPDAHPLHHRARDHRLGKGAKPLATTSYAYGYTPNDLKAAYAIPAGGAGRTVAIVDAYDNPNAEADLAAYRARFALPACTTANGCFRKVNQSGAASPLPAGDVGWGQEIALDIDMASAACPACNILLVEAKSSSLSDLATAVDTAVALGAVAVSNSYGANEWNGETYWASHWKHAGVAITASAGDNGYGVEFPAAASSVIAVGGTKLVKSTAVARGWNETAWTGSGSGCSAYVAKPAWQHDAGCARRTVADISAVADPNTGVAVYDSYGSSGGNWLVFGGTSVAAPIVAAMFAVAGNTAAAYNGGYIAARTTSLWDATRGSNGTCTVLYLCTARIGYDGPTGFGSPKGIGAL